MSVTNPRVSRSIMLETPPAAMSVTRAGTRVCHDENKADDDKHRCEHDGDEFVALKHAECGACILHIENAHPVADDRDAVSGHHGGANCVFGQLVDYDNSCCDQWINYFFHNAVIIT